MNVVFISPNFPPSYYQFAARLRDEGATVLAIGDAPFESLRPELREALVEYVHVHDMNHYESMLRAVAYLTWRHGRIDRLDSNNEHWLAIEADLRRDFNVLGQKPEEIAINRSKSGMKKVFIEHGIACAPGELLSSEQQARSFVAAHGFPLIIKPDTGVGAHGTYKVHNQAELEEVLPKVLQGFFIEAFVTGQIVSFDGLTDESGRILFCTAHKYCNGIMEIVKSRGPVHYYSLREIPEDLDAIGRASVAAMKIRGRFFHMEFFRLADERLLALEINVRPPGGFTTDMLNFASDNDVYRLWAQMISGRLPDEVQWELRYHAAHVARRANRTYAIPHDQLLAKLGPMVMAHSPMDSALSGAMGEYVYLIRAPEWPMLEQAIADIEREARA